MTGGTASLFSNYLASLGLETHSIDLNPELVEAGRRTAEAMGWPLHPYAMDMAKLDFPDGHFDHAFSICVFEHLEPVGGPVFHDNGKRYLSLPRDPGERYTFGAVFLRRLA